MSDLEESGFINHPHTSAGRIPTDKGYRYYVDALMEIQKLKNSDKGYIDKSLDKNSLETDDKELDDWWVKKQRAVMGSAFEIYDQALKRGIAKEQARAILPEGLTRSTIFMSGSIRSWIHYCELRTGPETQKEHREIAAACAVQIARVFPQIVGVLQHD